MKKSAGLLSDDHFLEVYSSLYDEFWCDRGSIRTFYYPLFLMRRMVYVVFQIFLNVCPAAQAYVNTICTVGVLMYLAVYRVFKERLVLVSQILGEFCVFVVFFTSSFFLYTDDGDMIKLIENICIYSIIFTIGIDKSIICPFNGFI